MARSPRIRARDIREIGRLIGDARCVKDPAEAYRILLDGAVKLAGADAGMMMEIGGWRPEKMPYLTALVPATEYPADVARVATEWSTNFSLDDDPHAARAQRALPGELVVTTHQLVPDAGTWKRFSAFHDLFQTGRIYDILAGGLRSHADREACLGMSLHRLGRKLYGEREIRLMRLLIREVSWHIRTGRLPTSLMPIAVADATAEVGTGGGGAKSDPTPPRLSPRLQQVLARLRLGQDPKQISREMKLSIHTVREYVAQIYVAYGVSGRSELMARLIRERE